MKRLITINVEVRPMIYGDYCYFTGKDFLSDKDYGEEGYIIVHDNGVTTWVNIKTYKELTGPQF